MGLYCDQPLIKKQMSGWENLLRCRFFAFLWHYIFWEYWDIGKSCQWYIFKLSLCCLPRFLKVIISVLLCPAKDKVIVVWSSNLRVGVWYRYNPVCESLISLLLCLTLHQFEPFMKVFDFVQQASPDHGGSDQSVTVTSLLTNKWTIMEGLIFGSFFLLSVVAFILNQVIKFHPEISNQCYSTSLNLSWLLSKFLWC